MINVQYNAIQLLNNNNIDSFNIFLKICLFKIVFRFGLRYEPIIKTHTSFSVTNMINFIWDFVINVWHQVRHRIDAHKVL